MLIRLALFHLLLLIYSISLYMCVHAQLLSGV